MNARRLARHVHVDVGAVTVTLGIAIGLGALTLMAGFPLVIGLIVGTSTGAISWWAINSEP
jgi:4-amino-4-deoxy-L-arabinose transferase-like glycosyltransferase